MRAGLPSRWLATEIFSESLSSVFTCSRPHAFCIDRKSSRKGGDKMLILKELWTRADFFSFFLFNSFHCWNKNILALFTRQCKYSKNVKFHCGCMCVSSPRKPRSLHMIRCGSSWAAGGTRWWWRTMRKGFIACSLQTTLSWWSPPPLSLPHSETAISPKLEAWLILKHTELAPQWVSKRKHIFMRVRHVLTICGGCLYRQYEEMGHLFKCLIQLTVWDSNSIQSDSVFILQNYPLNTFVQNFLKFGLLRFWGCGGDMHWGKPAALLTELMFKS